MASAPPSYDDVTKNPYGPPTSNYPGGYPHQEPPYPQQQGQYPPYPANPNNAYQPQPQPYNYQSTDAQQPYPAAGDLYGSDNFTAFSDKSIRNGFIRKVYLIMTAQLLVTCFFIAIFQFVSPVKYWVRKNPWFYYLSYAVFIVTYIALVCCPSVRRKYPGNFFALSIFTLALSYMTATIASFYETPAVLVAAGITAIVCISITIFAMQTKIDFTMCSGLILVLSLVLLLTGLSCAIIFATMGPSKVVHAVYAGLCILVFGIYLIYDTQLVIGGRKYELSPEDYIEGALQLYLDIVNMFLIILSLFGNKN